ncbi:MAG TPA: AsmA family protein, partial [Smithellaceae bacterium]|nr:AsmA family protein [Smithellaceae bacterium]
MGKKLLIAIGAIVAVIVVLIIVAAIIIVVTVDKDFIASRLAAALNRHVTIEKIDVSVFSIVSGIEVNKLAVSNFKTAAELVSLKGKAVPPGDLFAGMEAFRFKMKFLPLLQRKIELKEIVLQSPVINLVKNKQGALNIDDLIKTKTQPVAVEKKEEKKEATEPVKPISADDIPVAVAVGEIGMKDGTINYYDAQYDQTFQIYKLTT